MKERIDKFMKAVREKYPSNGLTWENLYRELSDLCKEDDRKELTKRWHEFQQEIKLAKWDDDFMELVINGAITKQARTSGVDYAHGAVMGWNDVMQQKMAESLRKDLRFHGVENREIALTTPRKAIS